MLLTFSALVYGRRLPCSLQVHDGGIVKVMAGNVPATVCLSVIEAGSLINVLSKSMMNAVLPTNRVAAMTQHLADLVEHFDEMTMGVEDLQTMVKLVQAAHYLNEAANALASLSLSASDPFLAEADKLNEKRH